MNLLFALLPYYILSNVHCLGMCGPIAVTMEQGGFGAWYLVGRLLGFSFFCALFALLGEILSFTFGGWLSIVVGLVLLFLKVPKIPPLWLKKWVDQENAWPFFFVGFCTPLLPCGQSLIVFSAAALTGDILAGIANGFAFAFITSLSLLLAMKGSNVLKRSSKGLDRVMRWFVMGVGVLAILRGLADLGWVEHFSPWPEIHLVLW